MELKEAQWTRCVDEQHFLDELFKLVSPEKLGEWLEVLVIRLAKLRPPFNIQMLNILHIKACII